MRYFSKWLIPNDSSHKVIKVKTSVIYSFMVIWLILGIMHIIIVFEKKFSYFPQLAEKSYFYDNFKVLMNNQKRLMQILNPLFGKNYFDPQSNIIINSIQFDKIVVSLQMMMNSYKKYFQSIPSGAPLSYSPLRIGSQFGFREDPLNYQPAFHTGIDFIASKNMPIIASGDGIVVDNSYNSNYGYYVTILHSFGYKSLYAHMLKRSFCTIGMVLEKGQLIGFVGNTGRSTGSHLHYEIIHGTYYQDPAPYITLMQQFLDNGENS